MLSMVAHCFNPSTQKAEMGGSQPGLHMVFQESQDYIETLSQNKTNKRGLQIQG